MFAGRGNRLFTIPSLRVRSLLGQVVGAADEDELSRDINVSASTSHTGLDGKGH
jgi:hypothetical protein